MVPFKPSKRRSLNVEGSESPSSSKIKVWVSAQISREMVPIARVACEPGDFQPQDQPDLSKSDFGNEPLEAQAVDSGSSRVA